MATQASLESSRVSVEFITRRQNEAIAREHKKRDSETTELSEEITETIRRNVQSRAVREGLATAPTQVQVQVPAPTPRLDIQEEEHIDWHTKTHSQVEDKLETSLKQGLTELVAKTRLSRDGENVIRPEKKNPVIVVILYLFSGFNVLLWISSLLCWIAWRPLGDPNPDPLNMGLAIILIVVSLTSALFSWWQEYSSSNVIKTIQSLLPQDCLVLRDGNVAQLLASALVVGDIVTINSGDRIPADIRLVTVKGLKIDMSALTGESEPISMTTKNTSALYLQTKNIAFMGTNAVEGTGIGIVVATGNKTVIGHISTSALSARDETTYLQREIRRVIIVIAVIVFVIMVAIVLDWVFFLRVSHPGFLSPSALVVSIIAMTVGFLPVGLPVCLTLALTLVAKEMYTKNVLVKKLPVVEALGSCDILASDKTGTLTKNQMNVYYFWFNNQVHKITLKRTGIPTEDPVFKEFVKYLGLCNNAKFVERNKQQPVKKQKKNRDETESMETATHSQGNSKQKISSKRSEMDEGDLNKFTIVGNASDVAIFQFSEMFSNVEDNRKEYPKICEIPFNSTNKWMLTVHNLGTKKEVLVLMKGAAEIILDNSDKILSDNCVETILTRETREKIKEEISHMGDQGLRVLAVCKKIVKVTKKIPVFSKNFNLDDYEIPTDGLTFIGLVALIDPPREEVPEVISQCISAGIRVMMVTGDHLNTATSIAKQVGIITTDTVNHVTLENITELIKEEEHQQKYLEKGEQFEEPALVIAGSEIPHFSPIVWKWILSHKELVFARTSPEHKLILVKACQAEGHVVGVTGDGVNDAPALKQAECGVAMGAGSDVAREASDLVLTDNNFRSVLIGVYYGRLVFANLHKVILYLFPAGSFSEIIALLASIFLGIPLPLSAFLMIYICVITDVFPSLSLVKEMGESNLMKEKPRDRSKHLVTGYTVLHAYGFVGVWESLCAFLMYFWYYSRYCGISASQLFLAFDDYVGNSTNFDYKSQFELDECKNSGQSVFFVALVVIQIFNAFSTRTARRSLFQHNPIFGKGKNRKIFLATFISLCCALFVIYVPFMNAFFLTRPVPWEFWITPFGFGILLFVMDELRKLGLRTWARHQKKEYIGSSSELEDDDYATADEDRDSGDSKSPDSNEAKLDNVTIIDGIYENNGDKEKGRESVIISSSSGSEEQ